MKLQSMFADDINRKINGVIKVQQKDENTELEVKEYVITKELKRHFLDFFNYYADTINNPTDDIGVWISGFFGSGKSHFLKMLSYILSNDEINGKKVVEYFREKFSDDPGTFMMIDSSTKGITETILFNIDIEGSSEKDKTAVLKVFAKMFYTHLGFYGENLKVAMLERYIEQEGKTKDFRRIFEEKKGKSWKDTRRAFAFNNKFIVSTLMEVLDMSEENASDWFKDKTPVEISIAQLVLDMNEYISKKPKDYRLLFMIDEVGQYVGTDTDLLLNLQSLIEEIGSKCHSKIWVMCTGQESIETIIKVRSDEFSRIQARFKTRLSLSSSAVDEVIQKRILDKTPEARAKLEEVYEKHNADLRNLFNFSNSILDIKGYKGSEEFIITFPCVPYQFIIMQKVFTEIRKHGNAGKHLSDGERSMLSGFQETVQKIQERNEYAIVPFFRFYDTLHSFLDGSIRRVIDRCEKAVENGDGIEVQDIDILKLLYLVRYIDDIKSNLDNIVILIADDIRADKINLTKEVKQSLERLISQNYISKTGETYNFLTDEEQDIQTEINNTLIDTSAVVDEIGKAIFGDIYNMPKYRYGKYDFSFDKAVDSIVVGSVTGGMKLRFLTLAVPSEEKEGFRILSESKGCACVVLAENEYFEAFENSMKIRKYIMQKNVGQLPKNVQNIINDQQNESEHYIETAKEKLKKAINEAIFYVDCDKIEVRGSNTKVKLNQTMEYLIDRVYSELNLITHHVDGESDIVDMLTGKAADCSVMIGYENNKEAIAKVEEFLDLQAKRKLKTSMSDIHSRYKTVPYGWKELDIAIVVARLIYDQKVTIKYSGTTIQANDKKLVELLHKKTEIGKAEISKRELIPSIKIKDIKEFLRDYFGIRNVPDDEDGLIKFIIDNFTEQKEHYQRLNNKYDNVKYPDQALVKHSLELIEEVLKQQKDNIALIYTILKKEDDLLDNKEDIQNIESFFKNQVGIFDSAIKMLENLSIELDYLASEEEANNALNKIRLMIQVNINKFNYREVPTLALLMEKVTEGHNRLLNAKREELFEIIRQCMEETHKGNMKDSDIKKLVTTSDTFFNKKKEEINEFTSIALLDGLLPRILQYKDDVCIKIEHLEKPPTPVTSEVGESKVSPKKKIIKKLNRQVVFPAKLIETEEDVDIYVEKMRNQLKELLKNSDGINIQ